MKKKFIKDLTENEGIHTPTEEIYNKVTSKFHELGSTWLTGDSYISMSVYSRYMCNTVLYPKNCTHDSLGCAKNIYTINDLKDFDMEKQITITSEQAKELYKLQPDLRSNILSDFTDEELGITPILKDWEDLDFKNTFYIGCDGTIVKEHTALLEKCHFNTPAQKHAKSMLAYAKLSMLMADLGDECKVDWEDVSQDKYCIYRWRNRLLKGVRTENYQFLAFKTGSVCDAFFAKHERLIKDYFMID